MSQAQKPYLYLLSQSGAAVRGWLRSYKLWQQRSSRLEACRLVGTQPAARALPRSQMHGYLFDQILKLPSSARSFLGPTLGSTMGFTDVRHSTRGNQDRIAVAYSIQPDPARSWVLSIVCDGVGGSEFGERAAALAISSIAEDCARRGARDAASTLYGALQNANRRVLGAYHGKSNTTVVAALFSARTSAIGWAGDSRAYRVGDRKVELLTVDDTLGTALTKKSSHLDVELSDEFADRLSQAIGAPGSFEPNMISWMDSKDDFQLLLCTDGVSKPLEPILSSMVAACDDSAELMRRLLIMSDWVGGQDNASGLLCPSSKVLRQEFNDPKNFLPDNFWAICLPGTSIVMPVPQGHTSSGFLTPLARPTAPATSSLEDKPRLTNVSPEIDEGNEQKKSARRKGNARGKNARSQDSASPKPTQLVIAEEILDDASTESADTVSPNGSPS